MAMINRDPFARTEIHRTFVPKGALLSKEDCAFCGMRNRRGGLYRYRAEYDGGRKAEDPHLFCSIACRRSYY